jgi:hypothetical protein
MYILSDTKIEKINYTSKLKIFPIIKILFNSQNLYPVILTADSRISLLLKFQDITSKTHSITSLAFDSHQTSNSLYT